MAGMAPYKDKAWLYEHYVTKRMGLAQMVKLLNDKYLVKTSHQTIYNWLEKYDLLKYRGKGKKMNANLQSKGPTKKRPEQIMAEKMRKKNRQQGLKRKN